MRVIGTLSHGAFPETRALEFHRDLGDLIVTAVSTSAWHRSRQLPSASHSVLLHRRSDLALESFLPDLPFPVNDVDVRDDLVVIGHGQYDGGAFFEGGLELWHRGTGKRRRLIADNREVLLCRFDGDRIRFTVSPVDDLDTWEDPGRTLTTYEIPVDAHEVELTSLTPWAVHEDVPYLPYQGPHEGIHRLETLARRHGVEYRPEGLPWAMLWRDEDLAVATGRGEVVLWHPDGSAERWDVGAPAIGLWDAGDRLLVATELPRRFDDPPGHLPTTLLGLDPTTGAREVLFRGTHHLSRTPCGTFLAEGLDLPAPRGHDHLITADGVRRITLTRPYPGCPAFSGGPGLYRVAGTWDDTATLVTVDPQSGMERPVTDLSHPGRSLDRTLGVHHDGLAILAITWRDPSSGRRTAGLRGVQADGSTAWEHPFPCLPVALAPLDPGRLAVLGTGGLLEIRETNGGSVTDSCTLPVGPAEPVSLAHRAHRLAVGLTDGRILLVSTSP
ncbi:hypothetical protein [Arachnia propionica]|uniref:hypothetical protein n=1 Tax=Arachnia propionica TaxID=1750 RepID=UPI00163B3679|nr:hypothetical protein [Arachnia propionica]